MKSDPATAYACNQAAPRLSDPHTNVLKLVFHHIPKTAGTSVSTLLGNIFGDAHVTRIHVVGEDVHARVAGLLHGGGATPRCVTGHIPYRREANLPPGTLFLTFLRDPLERVLSLYQFILGQDYESRKRLGLPPVFPLREFLASPHDEIIGQVNNGMCRFLCGIPEFQSPEFSGFWSARPDPIMLDAALETLSKFTVGIVERMPESVEIMRRNLYLPYPLSIGVENASVADFPWGASDLEEIASRNAMDMALYRASLQNFNKSFAKSIEVDAIGSSFSVPVYRAIPGTATQIQYVSGRQGFHEYEENNRFAWLRDDGSSQVNFAPNNPFNYFRLIAYFIVPDYPIEQTIIEVNGKRCRVSVRHNVKNRQWVTMEVGPFRVHSGLNAMKILPTTFVPSRAVVRDTTDARRLSIAIHSIAPYAAEGVWTRVKGLFAAGIGVDA